MSTAVYSLRETTVSMVLNLEFRDDLTCLGRKELLPVSVPRERSQELLLVISFQKQVYQEHSRKGSGNYGILKGVFTQRLH